jgi:hypothetical protein
MVGAANVAAATVGIVATAAGRSAVGNNFSVAVVLQ